MSLAPTNGDLSWLVDIKTLLEKKYPLMSAR
jgi:hypothetical protein